MATVTINSFVEDTCVLVAGAFLLVRGPLERRLGSVIWVGILCGLFGATEAIFPGDRYPYAPHTLAAAFACALAGPRAGILAAISTVLAAAVLLPAIPAELIFVQVLITVSAVAIAKIFLADRWWTVPAAVIGQLFGLGVAASLGTAAAPVLSSVYTVLANAFGLVLLLVVVRDASLRAESEAHRHEIDEVRRIAAEAKLSMLRSRVQPHFLFNSLNSIAALCQISPDRASRAAIQLGNLMRRSLELDFGKGITLKEELVTVNGYLALEQERYGPKLRVRIEVDECLEVTLPAFSVQILVENAVLHGVSKRSSGGEIAILARPSRRGWTVAVADDGDGIEFKSQETTSPHGLEILRDQLKAMYGANARLHLCRRLSGGTLASFHIPELNLAVRQRK